MMKRFKLNLPLCIGLVMFSLAHIAGHFTAMPHMLSLCLILLAVALELWGVVLIRREQGA